MLTRTSEDEEARGCFGIRRANLYLDLAPDSEWLLDPRCPIPKSDMRIPGTSRAMWRWTKKNLDAFLEKREVKPGAVNPMEP